MTPVTYRGVKMYPLIEHHNGGRVCQGCEFFPINSPICKDFRSPPHNTECTAEAADVTEQGWIWQSGAEAEVTFVLERLTS